MIGLDIKVDIGPALSYVGDVEKKVVIPATVRSLNRTLDNVNTQASRDIANEMGAKVSAIRKRLKKIRATRYRLIAELRASHYAPNLIEFGARQSKTGVTHKAWNRRQTVKGAFIAPGKYSGKDLVFARSSKQRNSAKALYGPTLGHTFVKERILRAMNAVVSRQWSSNFNANFNYYMSRLR